MRKITIILAVVFSLVATSVYAERKADFSDLGELTIRYPFNVIENTSYQDEYSIFKVTRVTESQDKVVEFFRGLQKTGKRIDNFAVIGVTQSAQTGDYTAILAHNNEHHYLTIKKQGSGSALEFKLMPNSYVSELFQLSLFGFRLEDETVIPAGPQHEDGL